jgi:RHS repeat-associated protein
VVEEVVGGAVTRQYTYGLQRINERQIVDSTWTPSFYGYDGGGTVRQLTNAAGAVTDTYDYDAFGNILRQTGSTQNNYLYRAEQYDSDLGLYYLRARYYNPVNGRFTGVDPLTDQGERRYEYADADPVDEMDPSGEAAIVEFLLLNFRGSFPVPFPRLPNFCSAIGPILGPIAGLLPFCNDNGSGGAGAGPGNPPPPCPCFAQLKYRAVDNRLAGKIQATHAFWYVQDSSGQQYTVSGGPWPKDCKEPNCKLDEWATPYPNSSTDATSGAGTWWSIGPSSSICPQVEDLLNAAFGFPNDTITYHWYGPNSNTSAHYVGNAGGFHPPPPPVALGWWNTPIP